MKKFLHVRLHYTTYKVEKQDIKRNNLPSLSKKKKCLTNNNKIIRLLEKEKSS